MRCSQASGDTASRSARALAAGADETPLPLRCWRRGRPASSFGAERESAGAASCTTASRRDSVSRTSGRAAFFASDLQRQRNGRRRGRRRAEGTRLGCDGWLCRGADFLFGRDRRIPRHGRTAAGTRRGRCGRSVRRGLPRRFTGRRRGLHLFAQLALLLVHHAPGQGYADHHGGERGRRRQPALPPRHGPRLRRGSGREVGTHGVEDAAIERGAGLLARRLAIQRLQFALLRLRRFGSGHCRSPSSARSRA
jgi:hypothetical protein